MKSLIINTNLNPNSNTTNTVTALVAADFAAAFDTSERLDLHAHDLPFCDGTSCYQNPLVHDMAARVAAADCIAWVCPIYNYDVNAAAKNFLELTNAAWEDKTVGFVCTAGGEKSYLSVLPFANSLMADHRCVIVPRYVYVQSADFVDDAIPENGDIRARLKQLAAESERLTRGRSLA